MTQNLDRGREAFHRAAWREAVTLLAAADASGHLRAVEDLEHLAVANYLVGQDEASLEAWSRVHQMCLDAGQVPRALRAAFWLTLQILISGEWARVSGWLARCRRLLDAGLDDCAECGLLLVLEARTAIHQGNLDSAQETSARALEVAEHSADSELKAFGLLVRGQALARTGNVPEAIAHLDEAMVAATIDGVSPIAVGVVYCAVIDACHQVMDLRRMREWTDVLTVWCRKQPDLVPFRGVCLVHRAEVLCISGAWASALDEARLACGALATKDGVDERTPAAAPIRGAAFQQLGEIQRLRGQFAEAKAAFHEANRHGCSPGAGLALLHLARGDAAGAATAIRRALAEPMDQRRRSATLAAAVEIETAAGHITSAHRASEELTALAAQAHSPWLTALAAQAVGTLLLVEGHARPAIDRLREAWMVWQDIEAPYEAARVRVAMGLAHRALGDDEAAMLEFDAARRVCERLGAAPELRRIDEVSGPAKRGTGAITPREHEVLRRLATGMTNRAIAGELFISERTVERHVSNILTKLDLSSRAAATAYAYEHRLV